MATPSAYAFFMAAHTSTPVTSVEVQTWQYGVARRPRNVESVASSAPVKTTEVCRRAASSWAVHGPPIALKRIRPRCVAGSFRSSATGIVTRLPSASTSSPLVTERTGARLRRSGPTASANQSTRSC